MSKIRNFFRCLKRLDTVYQAQQLNLIHKMNIYGDEIIFMNCRSLWEDEYGYVYYCHEEYDDSDIISERKLKIKKILKSKHITYEQ